MNLLLRAIITGFGLKLGSELGRIVAEQLGFSKPNEKEASTANDEPIPPNGLLDDTPSPTAEAQRTKHESAPVEPTLVVEPSPTVGD